MTCIPFDKGIVCIPREIDREDLRGVDLRTRKGQEAEVLAQVRKYKGFSVFWACETMRRARTVTRLIKAGVIKTKPQQYPWSKAWVARQKKRIDNKRRP